LGDGVGVKCDYDCNAMLIGWIIIT
jgi:hypothetical protein